MLKLIIFQLRKWIYPLLNLNTSHVKVNPTPHGRAFVNNSNLNTSHVKVNLENAQDSVRVVLI